METPALSLKGTRRAKVVSRAGDKTVVVAIQLAKQHRRYSKKTVFTKKYLVHDPHNQAHVGQVVTIAQTRPLSARKRWIIVA